jgi:hypothetical protein
MSIATNGITAEVIRGTMPPYHLSADLLEATFAALPPPPANAPPGWRQVRVARLTQEFAMLMPANAAQARIVSQVLIMRELADAIATRANAPGLMPEQMARVGRASAELMRTAAGLVRGLERQQQKPVPFFGTVLADGLDLAALDAVWGKGAAAATVERACATADASGPAAAAVPTVGSRSRGPDGPGGEPTRGMARVPCSVVEPGLYQPGDGRETWGRIDCDH